MRQCRNYFTGGNAASFRWDEGKAEAEVVVAISGLAVVPVRRTAAPRDIAPTAATDHAARAITIAVRTREFCLGIAGIVLIVIQTPFPNITGHIIQAKFIGGLPANFMICVSGIFIIPEN